MGFYKRVIYLLCLVTILIWISVFVFPDRNIHVIACNVGQGDAILTYYGSVQILIDGGPNNDVLDCLSRYIPFWDRKIELVILSHPQKDHYMGLIEVFRRYDIGEFVVNSLDSESIEYGVLKDVVNDRGIKVVNPKSGMRIRAGKIYYDIVWPSSEFLLANENASAQSSDETNTLGISTSSRDPNDFSIVTIVHFDKFDALFTGDIGPEITDELLKKFDDLSIQSSIEYLKVPHHGSKNGLTQELLDRVNPQVAVISVGKNQWGHPNQEILQMLGDEGIKVLRTDQAADGGAGDVEIVSDGEKWWQAK